MGLWWSLLALLHSAAAFLQPTTSDAYMKYLRGDWEVRRVISYKRGGISGRFTGVASFELLDDASKVLVYVEGGEFKPDLEQFDMHDTRSRLLYDFSDWKQVDVLYDLADDRSSAKSILAGGTKLYSLLPDDGEAGVMRTERVATADLEDTYQSGELEVSAEDAFLTTWNVVGPLQECQIMTLFRRDKPAAAGADSR